MRLEVYVTKETKAQLLAIAKRHGVSVSAVVRTLAAKTMRSEMVIDHIEELPHPTDAQEVPLVYVKPEQHDATGLIYTPALHAAGHINLENVRDDVYQEEQQQAARDAAKEQE